MGNREALLDAAKRCLFEKGYANTTARDIATSAGTSLAAIGYHYGSTEALLNAAMIEAMGEWGEQLAVTLAQEAPDDADDKDADALAGFERFWTRVIESFEGQRKIWAASFELFALVDRVPELRQQLAEANEEVRLGLGEVFGGLDPATDLARTRAVGSFYQALISGIVAQWLIDPERAPTAGEITEGLRIVAATSRTPPAVEATPR
ncbi:MAG TPA: helix-turn-helix domain-containing protein [Actinomycetes bacterium]|nr:helix-turn-helix domain-containing protein [Actinomycetes bacterium]